ncbi:MAG: PH domain-containing protein [Prevotellaceae bacterium]|jgi:hypothetical protein|nr:PH domain-containing protein [Prevotellaceae bacterium]
MKFKTECQAEEIIFTSKSTQDLRAWLKTVIVCFIPFMMFCIFISVFRQPGFPKEIRIFLALCIPLWIAIMLAGILCTPNKYTVSKTHLTVKRYLGDIKIPLKEIQDIRLFNRKGLVFDGISSDGTFGTYGILRTDIHEKLYIYTRRDSNWTLVVTSRKKYVIAPNDLYLINVVKEQIRR